MKTNRMHWRLTSFWLVALILSAISISAVDEGDRKIAPNDIIVIEVLGEKDLTRICRVQTGGTIVYPLLKSVEVGGKTTAEVAQLIADRLLKEEFLVSPEVSVDVKEFQARTVYVFGAVNKSGALELPTDERIDIIQAIAKAGGLSQLASKSKIELTRKGKKPQTYKFDELRKETDPAKKIWLEPGDIIYVGESFF
jgi:polysaccharide export outer membrane protein